MNKLTTLFLALTVGMAGLTSCIDIEDNGPIVPVQNLELNLPDEALILSLSASCTTTTTDTDAPTISVKGKAEILAQETALDRLWGITIAKVSFTLNGEPLGIATQSPYEVPVEFEGTYAPNGYTLRADITLMMGGKVLTTLERKHVFSTFIL